MNQKTLRVVPGILLLISIAVVGKFISSRVIDIDHLLITILIGILASNIYGIPDWAKKGVDTYKLWLEAGIVIMGARIVLDQVLEVGPTILLLVPVVVLFTITFIELVLKNIFEIDEKLGSLLAAGSSVCGVSAIVAVGGGIKARQEDLAYAVGTILLFDALTLFTYPLVGTWLGLPDQIFGIWAGLTMFSTGPVVAAGFSYSEIAGQWATITKLTRNVLIGFLAVTYAMIYARRDVDSERITNGWRYVWENFPKFIVGFITFIVIANMNLLSQGQLMSLQNAYKWLFVIAFAGLGLNIDIKDMRRTGMTPILVTLITLCTASVLFLLILLTVF
jgi:uncharacterized integral membrane protein (TIGR00698 family)